MSGHDSSPKRPKKTYLDQILDSSQRAMFREPGFLFPAPYSKPLLDDHLMAVEKLPAKRITKLYACAFVALFWADITLVGGVEMRNGIEMIQFTLSRNGIYCVGESTLIANGMEITVDRLKLESPEPLHILKKFLELIELHRRKEFHPLIWPLKEVVN